VRVGALLLSAVVPEQYCQTMPFVISCPRVDGVCVVLLAALPQVVVPASTLTPSEMGVSV